MSELLFPVDLYEEDLNEESTLDLTSQNLETVPKINNKLLCALYLQKNNISSLPDDFFPNLPGLMWLDLRDNQLMDLPTTIKDHPNLTHLLLQNNKITALPDELGTVPNLKVIQLSGNPLTYPAIDVIDLGIDKILSYLRTKYFDNTFVQSQSEISDTASTSGNPSHIFNIDGQSYNSVIDERKLNKSSNKTLSVQFYEKDLADSDDGEYYPKHKGKCPKLAISRMKCPSYYQSSKYVKHTCKLSGGIDKQMERIKESYLKDRALKKHKELLAAREKILQDRRNIELLKNWRRNYKSIQLLQPKEGKMDPQQFPYDTNPEYMTLLSREDIEKDLPDKYKKKLFRKCKPTIPRKNTADVHLAMRIKQLFENLEAIDKDRGEMTPRTEQKVLLGEIQKITEIKQKLMELSVSNNRSVTGE